MDILPSPNIQVEPKYIELGLNTSNNNHPKTSDKSQSGQKETEPNNRTSEPYIPEQKTLSDKDKPQAGAQKMADSIRRTKTF